jgi:hypothetical protein
MLTIFIFFPLAFLFRCLRTSIASNLQGFSNIILWLMLQFLTFDPTGPRQLGEGEGSNLHFKITIP